MMFDKNLQDLYDAEDFFEYFKVPYHPEILNVSRVHILKQFQKYLKESGYFESNESEKEVWNIQRALLFRAYRDCVKPTPIRQKFFPEFYKKNGAFFAFDQIRQREEKK